MVVLLILRKMVWHPRTIETIPAEFNNAWRSRPGTRELCVSTGGFGGMEGQPLGMFVVSNPFDVSDFASLTNPVLSVQGTDNADAVTVQDSSGNVTAIVGGISSQVFNGVTGIRIHGGGGAETISVQGIPIPATIHGGGGNVTITGGAGDDSIKGAAGNCSIIGGTGNDSIKGGVGNDNPRRIRQCFDRRRGGQRFHPRWCRQ